MLFSLYLPDEHFCPNFLDFFFNFICHLALNRRLLQRALVFTEETNAEKTTVLSRNHAENKITYAF